MRFLGKKIHGKSSIYGVRDEEGEIQKTGFVIFRVCDINGGQVALGFPKVVKMTGLNQKSVSIRYYKIMCNKEVFPV